MISKRFLVLLVGLAMAMTLAACGGGTASTTTSTTGTSTTPTATGVTFGSLAQDGQSVYSANCAACHGSNGEGGVGPKLVGNANMAIAYPTASQLLGKITNTMPQNSPGSLQPSQYQQVMAYIVVQNNWVAGSVAFDAGNLSNVNLG